MKKEETRIKEIEESINQKKQELDNLTRLVSIKQSEIKSLYDEIAYQYSSMEKYSSLIGKKVRISWIECNKTRSIDGYFKGFQFFNDHYYKDVYPKLAKIKKDGSMSMVDYSSYDLPSAKIIVSIEQI